MLRDTFTHTHTHTHTLFTLRVTLIPVAVFRRYVRVNVDNVRYFGNQSQCLFLLVFTPGTARVTARGEIPCDTARRK